ncbi:hypothetical protein TIFTF001_006807 [Ficus carica]|uniref:Uncharacterized protein n=1 Tax=Ficus carica TaxID=3494 RepID=A0AA88A500_FICCA|nr:hypothetical protein TIFTF001_006807 [Ficus carica]
MEDVATHGVFEKRRVDLQTHDSGCDLGLRRDPSGSAASNPSSMVVVKILSSSYDDASCRNLSSFRSSSAPTSFWLSVVAGEQRGTTTTQWPAS